MLSQFIARIRASPGLAVLVVLAAAAVYAFVQLVDEVLEGESRAFDEWILQALRTPGDPGDPIGPWWLETVFVDITALGGNTVVVLITLAVLGYLVIDGKRAAALLVLASVAGGIALSSALKIGFDRPRPDFVAHLVDVHTLSFPSGHAMVSAVTYLTLGALLAQIQARKGPQGLCAGRRRGADAADRREPGVSRRALAHRRDRRLVRRHGLGHRLLGHRHLAAGRGPDRGGGVELFLLPPAGEGGATRRMSICVGSQARYARAGPHPPFGHLLPRIRAGEG
jgi:hypothetical protein